MNLRTNPLSGQSTMLTSFVAQRADELIETSKCQLYAPVSSLKDNQTDAVKHHQAKVQAFFRTSINVNSTTGYDEQGVGESSDDLVRRRLSH